MKVLHECNIHCATMDPMKAETMGIKDKGKWLPFTFHMGIVVGCKVATDDEDEITCGGTTIYTEQGDTFVIDTPYVIFQPIYKSYHEPDKPSVDSEPEL